MMILLNIFKTDIINNTALTIGIYSGSETIINPEEIQLYDEPSANNRFRRPGGSNICQGEGN